jgi:hypothetical protein
MPIIRIIDITDMRYTNAEQTNIDMIIYYEGYVDDEGNNKPLPFHYVATDTEPMTLAVKDVLEGGPYPIAPYEDANSPPDAAGTSSVIAD